LRNMFRFPFDEVRVVPGVQGGLDWWQGAETCLVSVAGREDRFTVWKNVVSASSLNEPARVPVRVLVVPQSSLLTWMSLSFFRVMAIAPCLAIPSPVLMEAPARWDATVSVAAGRVNE